MGYASCIMHHGLWVVGCARFCHNIGSDGPDDEKCTGSCFFPLKMRPPKVPFEISNNPYVAGLISDTDSWVLLLKFGKRSILPKNSWQC